MDRAMWVGLLKDWGIAASVAAGVMIGWNLLQPDPVSAGEAPELRLRDLAGDVWSLEAKRDGGHAHAYIINYWATWCAPCMREIPEFNAFAEAHPEVEVVGVSVDEMPTSRLRAEVDRLGIQYRVLHDQQNQASYAWGVRNYPTTFVLDAERNIIASRVGGLDRAGLEELLPR